jgi:hypothetical protein
MDAGRQRSTRRKYPILSMNTFMSRVCQGQVCHVPMKIPGQLIEQTKSPTSELHIRK